jgi:hypothetical protein
MRHAVLPPRLHGAHTARFDACQQHAHNVRFRAIDLSWVFLWTGCEDAVEIMHCSVQGDMATVFPDGVKYCDWIGNGVALLASMSMS